MQNFLQRLQIYLAGLSATRKLAAGTLVAVMIVTGIWLTTRPTAAGMEPVLDQPFSESELAQIDDYLDGKSIPHEVKEGKIFVPTDRKIDALSDLFYADMLTSGTEKGFDALVKQISPWDAPGKTDKMFNLARQGAVQRVIGRFNGVHKVTVMIDPTSERHIGGSIQPTAMVDIQTHGGANPRQLSTAAVNVLTGAVANLSRDRVMVTIDGATFNARADERDGIDLIERRQRCEQIYAAKVTKILGHIPDVSVSVFVDFDVPAMAEDKRAADVEKRPQKQIASESADASTDSANEEPNTVVANAVPVIPPATVGTADPANRTGDGERVRSASITVPRSYFVQIYKRANKKDMEPDDALLQPVVEVHAAKIRNLVKNTLGLENDRDVTVEAYEDASQAPSATLATASPAPASTLGIRPMDIAMVMTGIAVVLGCSLLFRRSPVPAPISEESVVAPGERALVAAIEDNPVDEEAHQLFRRVRDLAAEDPDDAARVLRGWIYQG